MIALMADDCGALELSTLVWYIDGTRHPQPIKGGIGSSKNQVTCAWRGGVPDLLLERWVKPEKAVGGGWLMGGLELFYYFTVQSHVLYVWEKKSKVSFFTFCFFSLLS